MKANAAAPELVLLKEEDYPEELTEFLAYIRELDAEGGPHYARVDRGELERYLSRLGGVGASNGASPKRVLPRRGQVTSPAGKKALSKSRGMGEE